MNVLAIGCHPDDVECCCAGTLAKYAKRGDRVIVAHASTGNLGHTFNMDEWADAQGNTLSNSDPVSFEYSMKKAFFNKINNTAPENQRNFATKDNIGAKLHPLTIEQNAITSFKSRTTLVPCTANTIGSGLFLQADYAIGGADRTFYLSELAGPLEPECN